MIRIAIVFTGLFFGWNLPASAEDFTVQPLSSSETAAMADITERSVLSTVAFLASDEMAGRNTPSAELNIAAAFVAARFRGAGLRGITGEHDYFQTTEVEQFVFPQDQATGELSGNSMKIEGLLFAPEQSVSLSGLPVPEKSTELQGQIVIVDDFALPPQAVDNPGMALAAWSRRLTPIVRKGASAILVRLSSESILPEVARGLGDKPLSLPPQFLLSIPVLLIPSDQPTDAEIKLTVPAREKRGTPVHNVIGILPGSDPLQSKRVIMISAHLDHIGRLAGDRNSDAINNGADDNATGVTAVVTLADAFASLSPPPRQSVVFITFWGEEKGLMGSKYYSEHPIWPLDQTVAQINIEMIGRPEEGAVNKAWGTGWTRSTLGDQLAAGAARAGVTVFHREDVSEMLYTRSDNFPLAQKGVIAHSFSAGSLHADYHQPSDEVSKLNIPHMTTIIRGLFAGAIPIANGELVPSRIERQ